MKRGAIAGLILLSACSTQPPEQGSFFRTAQTQLSVQSTPSGNVNLDNRYELFGDANAVGWQRTGCREW